MQTRLVLWLFAATLAVVCVFTPESARSQSDALAGEESAGNTRVLLPLVNLPAALANAVTVRGKLTLDGSALTNTPFVLEVCPDNQSTPPLRIVGQTDATGHYNVRVPEGTGGRVSVSLRYPADAAAPVRGTLSSFHSNCFQNSGAVLHLPTIDLAGVELTSPGKGGEFDMPVLFAWQMRRSPGSNEVYQLQGKLQYDCISCEPVALSASQQPSSASSTLLECVDVPGTEHSDIVAGDFHVMIVSELGTGHSEVRTIEIGTTIPC